MPLMPNYLIEQNLSCWFQNQSELEQEQCFQAEIPRDSLRDRRSSEQVVLVDPVVNAQADEDEHGPERYK